MDIIGPRIRVLVVDDRPLVLAGIQAVLGDCSAVEVVGIATTAEEAVKIALAACPDIMLLNMQLAHHASSDLVAEARHARPLMEVVALADSDDAGDFQDALDGGVRGYLLDSASREDICSAVERVAAGKSHIDPAVSSYLVRAPRSVPNPDVPALTSRELDTLRLASQGLTNDAIARRLHLKTETVKTHLSNAFERLGAHDRTSAVVLCIRRGLF